jgi:hypothetical protein
MAPAANPQPPIIRRLNEGLRGRGGAVQVEALALAAAQLDQERACTAELLIEVAESEGGGAAGLGLGHAALGGAAAGAPERAGTGAAGAPAGSAGRGCGGAGRETAAERGEEGREECGELGGGPSAPSEEKGWAKLRSTARARKLSGREKYK